MQFLIAVTDYEIFFINEVVNIWDQSNRAYIMTHGVTGRLEVFKHPLPENVDSVYMSSWRDVDLTGNLGTAR
ncbi:MAG: hypothetical protein ABSE80_10225 [Halobacteriota archaeon]